MTEERVLDKNTGEDYVAITAKGAARQRAAEQFQIGGPGFETRKAQEPVSDDAKDLHFVPYYFRANRGGKGQMRVGLSYA